MFTIVTDTSANLPTPLAKEAGLFVLPFTYTIDGKDEKFVEFQMQQAGDFKRNHTWIVYAYYAGAGRLQVQSLYVKDWSGKEKSHSFYNW